jgi:hypothetical protein
MMISLKPSFIRPGLGDDCTICLHEGPEIWQKVYRSEQAAWAEARELGLIDKHNSTGQMGDQARHPLLRAMISDVDIELEEIKKRGFHK